MNELWQKIKRWSHAVGDFQARLILTILYGLLVLPTGLIARIGGDLLGRTDRQTDSYWQRRPAADETLPGARGQG